MDEKIFSIYILECSDGSYYTGMTTDLNERMNSHNEADERCSKHTKNRRPVTLVYQLDNIVGGYNARQGEKYIKSLTRERKRKIITGDQKIIKSLKNRINNGKRNTGLRQNLEIKT